MFLYCINHLTYSTSSVSLKVPLRVSLDAVHAGINLYLTNKLTIYKNLHFQNIIQSLLDTVLGGWNPVIALNEPVNDLQEPLHGFL